MTPAARFAGMGAEDLVLDGIFDLLAPTRTSVDVSIHAVRCSESHPDLEPRDMRASRLTPEDVRVPEHLDVELTVVSPDGLTIERVEAEADGQRLVPLTFRGLEVRGGSEPTRVRFEFIALSG
jgi:hypothetical protein